MKKYIALALSLSAAACFAQQATWPEVKSEMKPAARWWWLGSAVDKENLTYNMEEYARKGLGGLEITPIYGVQQNEKNDIDFLSEEWMEMYAHTLKKGEELGIKIDMNTGTGWPFGGPLVSVEDAATKVIFEQYTLHTGETLQQKIEPADPKQKAVAVLCRVMAYADHGKVLNLTGSVTEGRLEWTAAEGNWTLIAVFEGKTFQQVKRAAPGGEGYVMNHFSKQAVSNYLNRFSQAFNASGAPYPNSFFNDSYEVYGADWTPGLFEEFEKRRGYKLEEILPQFLSEERNEQTARIVSDYRETLSELLLENFTLQWTEWAHSHGSTTRNQAHGSPGNLIDLYATVDIPECESFGISDFNIKGLRTDTIKKINDSDLSMLKYASSAAHISGKPLVSSETFTWLTEHFRTSLSQCKPDLDLLFVGGVNHIFFHGTTYSPKEAQWPGWKFYASIDMSPTNSIWHDADAFFSYITRCQSFLQEGKADNDFLLYFPVYDMWYEQDGRLLMFDIHKMSSRAPRFISTVNNIMASGYGVDYISDKYLYSTTVEQHKLITEGGSSYKAIIVPGVRFMPLSSLKHLFELAQQGATVVFMDQYVNNVPGFANYENRMAEFRQLTKDAFTEKDFSFTKVHNYGLGKLITGSDYTKTLGACNIPHEEMKTKHGLHFIRRAHAEGHIYFVSALQNKDTEDWISLAVNDKYAVIFNPMDDNISKAKSRTVSGKTEFLLKLGSGESLILKTFTNKEPQVAELNSYQKMTAQSLQLEKGWELSFVKSDPQIEGTFKLENIGSWTDSGIEHADVNMGTACYKIAFKLPKTKADEWELDLGDVRESASIRVNGQEAGTLWAVPYKMNIGKYLKAGKNVIEVEVTNLPANRIAEYDRQGVNWRIFKEINFVKIDYKKGNYSGWDVMPSGLLGPVLLTPLRID